MNLTNFPTETLMMILSIMCEGVENFNIRLVNRLFYKLSTAILFSNAFSYIKADKLICMYIFNIPFEEILELPMINLKLMAILLCATERKDELAKFQSMLGNLNAYYSKHELIGFLKHLDFETFIETLYFSFQTVNERIYSSDCKIEEYYSIVAKVLLKNIKNLKSIDLSISGFQKDYARMFHIFNDENFGRDFGKNIKSVKLSKYWFEIPNIFNLLENTNIKEIDIEIGVDFVNIDSIMNARKVVGKFYNLETLMLKCSCVYGDILDKEFIELMNDVVLKSKNTLNKLVIEKVFLNNNFFSNIASELKLAVFRLKDCVIFDPQDTYKDFTTLELVDCKIIDDEIDIRMES